MFKKVLKYVLSLLLAAFFVWLVVRKVDWAAFTEGLKCTRWVWILAFVLASLAALVFRTLRWRDLVKPLDPEVKLMRVWDSINVGNLVNVALPGAGELLRCGYLRSPRVSYDKVLGTIFMERVWDVLAIVVVLGLALGLKWTQIGGFFKTTILAPAAGRLSLWWVVLIVLAVLAAVVWAVWHFRDTSRICRKVADALKGLAEGATTFFGMPHKFRFGLYTVGLWVMYVIMSWTGLKAVPELAQLTLADALFISAVGNLASVIPVPSGMGPYHYLVMTTLAALYACPQETGLLYAVLCHETHALLVIVLGVISYFSIFASGKLKK